MIINFSDFFDFSNCFSIIYGAIPIVLYCEIHFRLKWLKGFLYRKNPEILFDLPTRITSPRLPVLLMVKDSNKFPIYIEKAEILIYENGKRVKQENFSIKKSLSQLFYSQIFHINLKDFAQKKLEVKCLLYTRDTNKTIKIENHNLSKKFNHNFTTFVDLEQVNIPEKWLAGDLHVHSNYTEDQVEFGAELSSYIEMGKARGFDCVAVLDHSYDFDDTVGTWTFRDENFTKWKDFKEEVEDLNQKNKDFVLLPGYELSVDNGLGKNVHMGVINNPEIFQGSGDAMENLKAYPSEYYFNNILEKLDKKAIAFAAHPQSPQGFLHRKILKRGQWSKDNFNKKLDGYQILNGNKNEEFHKGKQIWIDKITSGKRTYVFAGTDAHGNFNTNLSVKYPLLSLEETAEHIFGEFFTFINCEGEKNVDNIVENLKQGKSVISDGPFLNIQISDGQKNYGIGDEIQSLPENVSITAASNSCFGKIACVKIIVGNCKTKSEQMLELLDIDKLNYEKKLGIILKPEDCYIRAELETDKNKFALTNPIWVNCKK